MEKNYTEPKSQLKQNNITCILCHSHILNLNEYHTCSMNKFTILKIKPA